MCSSLSAVGYTWLFSPIASSLSASCFPIARAGWRALPSLSEALVRRTCRYAPPAVRSTNYQLLPFPKPALPNSMGWGASLLLPLSMGRCSILLGISVKISHQGLFILSVLQVASEPTVIPLDFSLSTSLWCCWAGGTSDAYPGCLFPKQLLHVFVLCVVLGGLRPCYFLPFHGLVPAPWPPWPRSPLHFNCIPDYPGWDTGVDAACESTSAEHCFHQHVNEKMGHSHLHG